MSQDIREQTAKKVVHDFRRGLPSDNINVESSQSQAGHGVGTPAPVATLSPGTNTPGIDKMYARQGKATHGFPARTAVRGRTLLPRKAEEGQNRATISGLENVG
jgi:hypothetical protein